MKLQRNAIAVALMLAITQGNSSVLGGERELVSLLQKMPADAPVSLVLVNARQLDAAFQRVQRRFSPGEPPSGFLANIKDDLPIGDWVNFSEPIGVTFPTLDANTQEGVLWVRIDNFEARIKNAPGAEKQRGVWSFQISENNQGYAKSVGDYVMLSTSGELIQMLLQESREGQTLDTVYQGRMNMFRDHDAVIHFNMDPVRDKLMGSVMQMTMMAPMIVAMAGQQGGNAAMISGFISVFSDMAQKVITQLAYVDLGIRIDADAVNASFAFGHLDGTIRRYLSQQKSASKPLLGSMADQPYFLAVGYEVPGEESPFFDYIFNRLSAAANMNMPGDDGHQQDTQSTLELSQKFARMVEGQNFMVSVTEMGLQIQGDYTTRSPDALIALMKKSPGSVSSMLSNSGGVEFKDPKTQRIGSVNVETFELSIDPNNPAGASVMMFYGMEPLLAMGTVGDRVRFYLGAKTGLEKAFSNQSRNSMLKNRFVQQALEALPNQRNALLLIDPAGILPLIGPMLGINATDIPPGPPIGLSISLSGDPAQINLHVPFRAIERVMQAIAPPGPM